MFLSTPMARVTPTPAGQVAMASFSSFEYYFYCPHAEPCTWLKKPNAPSILIFPYDWRSLKKGSLVVNVQRPLSGEYRKNKSLSCIVQSVTQVMKSRITHQANKKISCCFSRIKSHLEAKRDDREMPNTHKGCRRNQISHRCSPG